jgi:hypothetical protein
MITEVISAILQILVFTFIPFIVYLIQKKSAKGFFDYIGLKKSNNQAKGLALIVSLIFIFGALGLIFINDEFMQMLLNPKSLTGKFRQMGVSTGSSNISGGLKI